MGSKCLDLDVGHMCMKCSCQKNMFGWPLKLILGFFGIFYIFGIKQKYSYKIMYECEKSLLTSELSYIGPLNFLHLNLFHVNITCKK